MICVSTIPVQCKSYPPIVKFQSVNCLDRYRTVFNARRQQYINGHKFIMLMRYHYEPMANYHDTAHQDSAIIIGEWIAEGYLINLCNSGLFLVLFLIFRFYLGRVCGWVVGWRRCLGNCTDVADIISIWKRICNEDEPRVTICFPITYISTNVSRRGHRVPGWGLLIQFPPFHYFPNFSVSLKHTLAIEYHIYIWWVWPQLSFGDTWQISMWFKEF